jgi:hypothetical protein
MGDDLLVLSHAQAYNSLNRVRECLRNSPCGLLSCPDDPTPPMRALVLDQTKTSGSDFLSAAADICQGLNAALVVLTVDRSIEGARQRQRAARDSLGAGGKEVEFDIVTGTEARAAAARFARWRHCQLVITPRDETPTWRRWLHRGNANWVTNEAEFASVLSLPEGCYRAMASRPKVLTGRSQLG